jgi:hypothetical protein
MDHLMRMACGVLLTASMISIGPAHAEDRGAWFKSLRQPNTGISCCDVADCRRTDANWHGGQWWAIVEGEWTPIPPEKEVDRQSIDGEAYVCSGRSHRIYCFVKPSLSM